MSGLAPVPTSRKEICTDADQLANARRSASRSSSPVTSPVPAPKAYVKLSPVHVQVVENAGPVDAARRGSRNGRRDAISLVASSKMPLAGRPCITWYWANAVDVTSSRTFVGSASSGVAAAAASAR